MVSNNLTKKCGQNERRKGKKGRREGGKEGRRSERLIE